MKNILLYFISQKDWHAEFQYRNPVPFWISGFGDYGLFVYFVTDCENNLV